MAACLAIVRYQNLAIGLYGNATGVCNAKVGGDFAIGIEAGVPTAVDVVTGQCKDEMIGESAVVSLPGNKHFPVRLHSKATDKPAADININLAVAIKTTV